MDTLAKRLSYDSDLTETSILNALKDLNGETPKMLIVETGDSFFADRLAEKLNVRVVVIPSMKKDSWCLIGEFNSIYSPGA